MNKPVVLHLGDEAAIARKDHGDRPTGRYARTLVKDGPMRVTLITLESGSAIQEHSAEGPITVQVISGAIRFSTADTEHYLVPGSLLSLAAGVRHAVAADAVSTFLLTIALPQP